MKTKTSLSLDRLLIEELCNTLSIREEVLYSYIYLRYLIVNDKAFFEEVGELEIGKYILDILNIEVDSGKINYLEQEYSIGIDIVDIVEDMKTRASDQMEAKGWDLKKNMKLKMDEIRDIALKNNANKYPKAHIQTYYKYFGLMELNEIFGVKLRDVGLINGIRYTCNHNPFKRREEEVVEAIINSIEMRSHEMCYIAEKKLEEYLIRNLEKIEEGLKFVSNQLILDEGRIDILAKDKDDNMVIIELKIKEDKNILWQSLYYPKEIVKRYNKNTRMIILAPTYSNTLISMLKNISNAELYTYIPTTHRREIINIWVNKI